MPPHKPRSRMTSPPKSQSNATKAAKQRIDQLLVDRGLAESRTRAQALVLAGVVFSGETKLAKPGQTVARRCSVGGARA